jgi:hypothetical protein
VSDELDLEELERFERSRIGQVYAQRVLRMAERHVKACQDRNLGLDQIRASQGALEIVYAVLGLPKMLRQEIEKKGNDARNKR